MKADVKYYGMIAEKLNRTNEKVELVKGMNLRAYFENKYPELTSLEYKLAINQEIKETIDEDINEVEIALLPPFAGG
jgi:molybdopterin synthase sulfur carrier subunit